MRLLKAIGYHTSLIMIYFANSARAFIFPANISGARIILVKDGKVLLVNHFHAPWVWTLPGGGIEKDETPEAAAIREIKEETGLTLLSMTKIGAFLNSRKGETHVFYSTSFEGVASPTVKFEIMECKWFPINELPEEFFAVDRGHVENYLRLTTAKS